MEEPEMFFDSKVMLYSGDCLEALPTFAADTFDSCVCDPPYHLASIVKRFGKDGSAPAKSDGATGVYKRASAGFMGKRWDGGDIAFCPETWAQVLRVLKPGAHLAAFAAPKNAHRLTCAIEDAGFEIRDVVFFCFGTGFPKSHSVNKQLRKKGAICRCGASDRDLPGLYGAEDSPSCLVEEEQADVLQSPMSGQESVGLHAMDIPAGDCCGDARKPGAGSGEEARPGQSGMEGRRDLSPPPGELRERPLPPLPGPSPSNGAQGWICDGASLGDGSMGWPFSDTDGMRASSRSSSAQQRADESGTMAGQSQPQDVGAWPCCGRCGKPIIPEGIGTMLKPAYEPIIIARKPLDGTVAENVLAHGVGGINIDGCRIEHATIQGGRLDLNPHLRPSINGGNGGHIFPTESSRRVVIPNQSGRWPANIAHDGSAEVVELFPDTSPSSARARHNNEHKSPAKGRDSPHTTYGHDDSGSAARFFYCAKATADDRIGSKHPTIKPIALLRWLVRLVTPRGGLILDPFAGTGTVSEAGMYEGMRSVAIELEADSQADFRRRMALVMAGPEERARAIIKARGLVESFEETELGKAA